MESAVPSCYSLSQYEAELQFLLSPADAEDSEQVEENNEWDFSSRSSFSSDWEGELNRFSGN